MLCSVSAGTKSGSNWLDRLRSTKGFPATENLDLDNFLSNSSLLNPSISESTLSHNKRVTSDQTQFPDTSSENGEKEWFGLVTNVLCDLFNMGDSQDKNSRLSGTKSSRKQTNPKFFDIESVRKEECVQVATPASFRSDNNSNVVGMNADCFSNDDDNNVDEEKEKCSSDKELKGYSKSEVTVIDTSFEMWKFDKLVFRRKNIWKVRDKKGKSWSFSSKKRKGNQLESAIGNGNVGCKKKAKMSSDSQFASSKESNGGDFALPSNDDHELQNNKREVCKDTFDNHFQVSGKRIHFSRSSRKSKKNGSSVILIKAVPTSKKCGRNLPKNCLKDTQRQ
eukprot:XP_015578006.1 uncharacterized protein LOC8269534 isoform X2 [Ricinus communis]